MKKCGTCKIEKVDSDFYINRLRKCLTHNCKSCTRNAVFVWNLANPEKAKAREMRYRESHRKEIARRTREWYRKNKKRSRKTVSDWCKRNPQFGARRMAQYRATQANATPAWANQFFIEEIYDLAKRRTKLKTGGVEKWSVDHIVPLKSPIVCGLHVHNNLQVIPAVKNSEKGNRHWPDMP